MDIQDILQNLKGLDLDEKINYLEEVLAEVEDEGLKENIESELESLRDELPDEASSSDSDESEEDSFDSRDSEVELTEGESDEKGFEESLQTFRETVLSPSEEEFPIPKSEEVEGPPGENPTLFRDLPQTPQSAPAEVNQRVGEEDASESSRYIEFDTGDYFPSSDYFDEAPEDYLEGSGFSDISWGGAEVEATADLISELEGSLSSSDKRKKLLDLKFEKEEYKRNEEL